ncbi:MAG: SDR family oxidoreductase [Hyphomicrobiaceae bacterium]
MVDAARNAEARDVVDAAPRKVAVVTGAGTGIGAATALALARAGVDVVVNYRRSRDAADEVAASCRTLGVEAIAHQDDVADDAACRNLVAATLARFGRLDILVNNAGGTKVTRADPLEEIGAADFDAMFAGNVRSAFQMARAAVAPLKECRGTIVNMSSHSGHSGYGSSMVYAATKGALNTLTLGLARRLAPEIRVNAVCPGFVATDWMRKARGLDDAANAAFIATVRGLTPLGEVVTAVDVAEAVVFLALGARAITGQFLVIDGGAHLTVAAPVPARPAE